MLLAVSVRRLQRPGESSERLVVRRRSGFANMIKV